MVNDALRSTFGGQVKHRRQLAGIGLRTFAQSVSIATSTLQGIEANAQTPSVFVAWRIACALGTTVDDLIRTGSPISSQPCCADCAP